jgi:hypothetical protein
MLNGTFEGLSIALANEATASTSSSSDASTTIRRRRTEMETARRGRLRAGARWVDPRRS